MATTTATREICCEDTLPTGMSQQRYDAARQISESEHPNWERTNYGPWQGSLSQDEKNAIFRYTSGNYELINGPLRGLDTPLAGYKIPFNVTDVIADLDESLARAVIREDLMMWRGGSDIGLKVGDVFVDQGFVSTSLSKEVAEDFIHNAFYEIVAPSGSKGASIAGLLEETSYEQEILLPRGTRFKVRKITERPLGATGNKMKIIELEVLP